MIVMTTREKLQAFWRWLWSAHYSQTAACKECGEVRCKSRMVRDNVYGWFCSDAEAAIYIANYTAI